MNSTSYKETKFAVGDTIQINYRIKEDDKERLQLFEGIVLKITGQTPQLKTITVRKMTRSGIGVERIIPLSSPFIQDLKVTRTSNYAKAKLYFLQGLSDQALRSKLYQKAGKVATKKAAAERKEAVEKKVVAVKKEAPAKKTVAKKKATPAKTS